MKSLDRVLNGCLFKHGAESHLDEGIGGLGNKINDQPVSEFPYLNPNPTVSNYYPTTNFSNKDRYDIDAPYNQAPSFNVKNGIGLPLTHNFDYDHFVKTTKGNNRETYDDGYDLPLYITLPKTSKEDSFQWDSFPAGEAQQFLVFSVDSETINSKSPLNGETGGTVTLEAKSSSATKRPYTITLSVTPYNAGPIPHIHWAEDEAFIMLQGEMDSWIGDPGKNPYELYEFPEGNDVDGNNFPPKKNTKQLSAQNVENFYYGHLMAEDGVYLPRGHAHAYRNASPNGDPLVFLTLWSRTPGYPEGGIEEFFTLSEPTIGRFYDNADEAASYGNLYNKNIGSEDGISNQQRFVDYFNTFPEYYVAMSRNFGSFTGVKSDSITKDDGTALTMGGNWNPMISTDTGTFPTPPPAAWDENSETPWIATPGEKGSDNYYTAPAPNAPSEAVNFSTPFDPKIIQRIELSYDKSNNSGISRQRFNQLSSQLATLLEASNGSESTDLLNPKSSNVNNEVLTVWDSFSNLNELRNSTSFQKLTKKLNKSGSVNVINSSVDTDLASNYEISAPEQMLLGKFQIKDGSRDEVLNLSSELKIKTNEEPGNLSFDYYFEKNDQNSIYFIEHYKEGKDIAAHLQKGYTAKFFEDFAPYLETESLADGDVSIYPVNTPESQIYIDQQQGIELFDELLDSMPEMAMTLAISNNKPADTLYTSNKTDTKGYGSFLNFEQTYSDNSSWTYGVIAVDNKRGKINGLSIGKNDQPNQNWLEEAAARTTILFETDPSFQEGNNHSRNIQVNTKSHYLPFRTRLDANSVFKKNLFNENMNIEFSKDDQLSLNSKRDKIQFNGMEASYDNVIQGMSTVTSLPQTKGMNIIDTKQQPRRTLYGTIERPSFDENSSNLALIQCNSKGQILDPVTGRYHKITTTDAQQAISAMEQNGELDYLQDSFEIEGGNLYTPLIKESGSYYTFKNSESSILGSNTFGMKIDDTSEQFSFVFTHSEDMPLLA